MDRSVERAGAESARQAIADGDCRLMAIKSHFTSIPLLPEGETDRLNRLEDGLKFYNGPHHMSLENEADERLNRIGFGYARAYNGHIIDNRDEANCRLPRPKPEPAQP